MDILDAAQPIDELVLEPQPHPSWRSGTAAVAVMGGAPSVIAPPMTGPGAAVDFATTVLPRTAQLPSRDRLLIEPGGNRSPGYLLMKRAIDVVGAVLLLVLLSPVMLAALAVLTVTMRGKPFFGQERMGRCGRRFRMYKFRTMHLDAERMQHLVTNETDGPAFKNRRDPRITRFGRFLRSFSIDEMPQLVNVLLGEMSLVGPRPLPTHEALKCQADARRRFSIKPGLTCLWQVSGRSEIGFDEWVRMDLWYLRNQSVWTDLKLLLRTPLSVLSRRGAY